MAQSSLALLSFSANQETLDRVRLIAAARQMSVSQVMREALALALAHWGVGVAENDSPNPEPARNEAPERTNVRWPLAARRHAARHGLPLIGLDSQ
jgi:hypothetical protein